MFKWFWEKRLKMWVRQNVRQTEIKWKIGGTTLRGGINLQLSPAAAFCCFLPTAETFDNSCKFTFGFLPTFKCDPCGMQAEVGMAGSTIYCIFSAGVVTRRLGGIPEHVQDLFHLILVLSSLLLCLLCRQRMTSK